MDIRFWCLLVFWLVSSQVQAYGANNEWKGSKMTAHAFKLYGHRGCRGLMPENTIPAYARALELKVDFVDMDVVMTRDKVVVVYHDLSLNPDTTRDSSGHWVTPGHFINQMTWKELQQYDVGRLNPNSLYASYFPDQTSIDNTPIPSLEQVIDYVKANGGDQIGFQIEIKDDPAHPETGHPPDELALAVARILQKKNIVSRTEVQAFNWQCLLALQQIDPRIATAFLTDSSSEKQMRDPDELTAGVWTGGHLLRDYDFSTVKMIHSLNGQIWGPEDIEVTEDNLNAAHEQGLRVVAWSIPKGPKMDVDLPLIKKLIDMGIDGIITDRPDKVLTLRDRYSD